MFIRAFHQEGSQSAFLTSSSKSHTIHCGAQPPQVAGKKDVKTARGGNCLNEL